ncbi:hypothetical protein E4U43_006024 [Claviceps pusilla]|uniref:Uncharacterized protein n=1 Tax=Claviceps pusilla TaxID=123648 RepID=A0A9P7SVT7_9HYPO|nr:hypothetical protein E4U43_006024 [Claviceps pusilla]
MWPGMAGCREVVESWSSGVSWGVAKVIVDVGGKGGLEIDVELHHVCVVTSGGDGGGARRTCCLVYHESSKPTTLGLARCIGSEDEKPSYGPKPSPWQVYCYNDLLY